MHFSHQLQGRNVKDFQVTMFKRDAVHGQTIIYASEVFSDLA